LTPGFNDFEEGIKNILFFKRNLESKKGQNSSLSQVWLTQIPPIKEDLSVNGYQFQSE
jgi:hypothetical protein